MTNAIEQAKREYARAMHDMTHHAKACGLATVERLRSLEDATEEYLELLRQDHEALHETARARFEDIGKLEAANQELAEGLRLANENVVACAKHSAGEIVDLESRLAKMTEERDSIQLRLHAVDHAYKEQQDRTAIPTQDSGDRSSCETPDAKTTALLRAVEDIQLLVAEWAVGDHKARKVMRKIAGLVNGNDCYLAMLEFEKAQTCMHSFFAIGDDQMKCTFCGVGK